MNTKEIPESTEMQYKDGFFPNRVWAGHFGVHTISFSNSIRKRWMVLFTDYEENSDGEIQIPHHVQDRIREKIERTMKSNQKKEPETPVFPIKRTHLLTSKDMGMPELGFRMWADLRTEHPTWFQKISPNRINSIYGLIPEYQEQAKEIIRQKFKQSSTRGAIPLSNSRG